MQFEPSKVSNSVEIHFFKGIKIGHQLLSLTWTILLSNEKFHFVELFKLSSLFISFIIYGIPRMGQNFENYPEFQQKAHILSKFFS